MELVKYNPNQVTQIGDTVLPVNLSQFEQKVILAQRARTIREHSRQEMLAAVAIMVSMLRLRLGQKRKEDAEGKKGDKDMINAIIEDLQDFYGHMTFEEINLAVRMGQNGDFPEATRKIILSPNMIYAWIKAYNEGVKKPTQKKFMRAMEKAEVKNTPEFEAFYKRMLDDITGHINEVRKKGEWFPFGVNDMMCLVYYQKLRTVELIRVDKEEFTARFQYYRNVVLKDTAFEGIKTHNRQFEQFRKLISNNEPYCDSNNYDQQALTLTRKDYARKFMHDFALSQRSIEEIVEAFRKYHTAFAEEYYNDISKSNS